MGAQRYDRTRPAGEDSLLSLYPRGPAFATVIVHALRAGVLVGCARARCKAEVRF